MARAAPGVGGALSLLATPGRLAARLVLDEHVRSQQRVAEAIGLRKVLGGAGGSAGIHELLHVRIGEARTRFDHTLLARDRYGGGQQRAGTAQLEPAFRVHAADPEYAGEVSKLRAQGRSKLVLLR